MSIARCRKRRYKFGKVNAKLSTKEAQLAKLKAKLSKKEAELSKKEAELSKKEDGLNDFVIRIIGDKWKDLDFLNEYCIRVHGKQVRTLHAAWECIFPNEYTWISEEQKNLVKMTKEELESTLFLENTTRSTSYCDLFNFATVVNKAKRKYNRVDVYYDLFDIRELIKKKKKISKLQKISNKI